MTEEKCRVENDGWKRWEKKGGEIMTGKTKVNNDWSNTEG